MDRSLRSTRKLKNSKQEAESKRLGRWEVDALVQNSSGDADTTSESRKFEEAVMEVFVVTWRRFLLLS